MKANLKKILKFVNSNRLKIGITFIALLVVTIIIKAIFFSGISDPTKSNAFFIKNESNKYALFDDKGKQLTEFIFKEGRDLFNNISVVENNDGNKAVINNKGKYVIDFGKYESLKQYGGLIYAIDSESNKYLLNSKGKKLLSKKNFTITSSGNTSLFATVAMDNHYYVYNYLGDVIRKYKTEEGKAEIPNIDEKEGYAAISFEKETYIVNTDNFKKMTKIKDKNRYCISLISEDKETIVLNSCKSWYEKNDKVTYKYMIGKRVYDAPNKCEKLYLDNDNLACTKDKKSYLLLNKKELVKDDLSIISYQTPKKYLKSEKNELTVVKNGKEKSKIADYRLSDSNYNKDGIFLAYNVQKNNFAFIDINGNIKYNKTFAFATSFDKNNLAKVYEKNNEYYLINTSGKTISNKYTSIFYENGYYVVAKDDKKGLVDKKGKEIVKLEYSNVEVKEINDKFYAYLTKNDKFILIDLKSKKEIVSTKSGIIFKDNYIESSDDDKDVFYTYEGKLIYKTA